MDMLDFNLVANKPGGELQGAGVPSESPGAREGFAASLRALYNLGLFSTTEDGQTTENAHSHSSTSLLGEEDPGELNNRWDDPAAAALKAELTRKLLFAEMAKEPLPMPRIASA